MPRFQMSIVWEEEICKMVVPYEDGAAISDLMRTSAARITRGRLWEKYLPTQTPPLSDLIIRPCDVEIQTAEGAILWEQDLVEDVLSPNEAIVVKILSAPSAREDSDGKEDVFSQYSSAGGSSQHASEKRTVSPPPPPQPLQDTPEEVDTSDTVPPPPPQITEAEGALIPLPTPQPDTSNATPPSQEAEGALIPNQRTEVDTSEVDANTIQNEGVKRDEASDIASFAQGVEWGPLSEVSPPPQIEGGLVATSLGVPWTDGSGVPPPDAMCEEGALLSTVEREAEVEVSPPPPISEADLTSTLPRVDDVTTWSPAPESVETVSLRGQVADEAASPPPEDSTAQSDDEKDEDDVKPVQSDTKSPVFPSVELPAPISPCELEGSGLTDSLQREACRGITAEVWDDYDTTLLAGSPRGSISASPQSSPRCVANTGAYFSLATPPPRARTAAKYNIAEGTSSPVMTFSDHVVRLTHPLADMTSPTPPKDRNSTPSSMKDLQEENRVYKYQCKELQGMLFPQAEEIRAKGDEIARQNARIEELSQESSIFREQCEILSASLENLSRQQGVSSYIDTSNETATLKKEVQSLRSEVSKLRAHLQDHNTLKERSIAQAGQVECLSSKLQVSQDVQGEISSSYIYLFCNSLVSDMVNNSAGRVDDARLRASEIAVSCLQRELQSSLREVQVRSEKENDVEEISLEIKRAHEIQLRRKDMLIRELKEELERGVGQCVRTVVDDAAVLENAILQERVSAAEDLNSALQKMLCEQEMAVKGLVDESARDKVQIDELRARLQYANNQTPASPALSAMSNTPGQPALTPSNASITAKPSLAASFASSMKKFKLPSKNTV